MHLRTNGAFFSEKPSILLLDCESNREKPYEADGYRLLLAFMPVIVGQCLLWHSLSRRLQAKGIAGFINDTASQLASVIG